MTMVKSINMAMSRLQGFFYWLIFGKFEPENNDFNPNKGFLMERKKIQIRQLKDFIIIIIIIIIIIFGVNCQIFKDKFQ